MSYMVSMCNARRVTVRKEKWNELIAFVRAVTQPGENEFKKKFITWNSDNIVPFVGNTIDEFIDYIKEVSPWEFVNFNNYISLEYTYDEWRTDDEFIYLAMFAGFIDQTGWEKRDCAYVMLCGEDHAIWYCCMRDGEFRICDAAEPIWTDTEYCFQNIR